MKLKKLKKSKYSNLNLQILKLFSKKKNFNSKTEINLTKILLNKIGNIVYLYHVTNKTILFVGFSTKFTKLLKTTKHILVPEFMWQNNIFNMPNNNKKVETPKNILKLQTKLNKKVDLVIINNLNINKTSLRESYLAGIPTITISEKINIAKMRSNYNSTGSYNLFSEKAENNNFFYLFVKTILTRAKAKKKYKI